ncbi:MAG TPA: tetratricopeptide repeat protein [Pirellulales bacterium]|jgi:tetratricopeptide (TPR) repeat protein|nr:tetratricopeptide repeat protein [Pirellulales bacterium]
MKAMTSRRWALALNLLILGPLAAVLTAEERGQRSGDAAPAAEAGSVILVSESVAEPAAKESEDQAATDVDDPAEAEPGVLPGESDADETEIDEDNPERVITPMQEGEDDRRVDTRHRHTGPVLTPAKRKVPLATTPLEGIQPGTATKEDLLKVWGAPTEVRKQHGTVSYKYRLKDGSRATVSLDKGVVSTIAVQIDPPTDLKELVALLGVDKVSSVEVADEDGQILGEAFPECGLLFGYAPEVEPIRVSQLIVEALDPQPFLLRAEAELDADYAHCLADANAALEIDPKSAAAQAMRSRVYRQAGDLIAALQAAEAAVALEPKEAEWRLVLAKVLVQLSDFGRAKQQLQEVLDNSASDPLALAGAHLLMGDAMALSSGEGSAAAVEQHQEAIRLLKPMANERRARRRRKACELLVDAHVHVAYSIGWGYFQHRSDAVNKWLDGAVALADDLVQQGVLRPEVKLRVNEQALAALAGLPDPPDVSKWENAAMDQAKVLFDEANDPLRAKQIQWQLGLALCDAVQIEQTRHNYDRAVAFGKLAAEHLKRADAAGRQLPDHDFLLGQLFYRLGAIQAVSRQDHEGALAWYGRAVKLLESPVPSSRVTDPGRHGETFVSIGVSYWETGHRDEAMRLTREGVKLMEQAVDEGLLPKAALAIPYSNLASMYTELGDPRRATEFATLATKSQREKK